MNIYIFALDVLKPYILLFDYEQHRFKEINNSNSKFGYLSVRVKVINTELTEYKQIRQYWLSC